MGKRQDKDTLGKVLRGLAQQTPSAAQRNKDEARAKAVERERARLQGESDRTNTMLRNLKAADDAHNAAEDERRRRR